MNAPQARLAPPDLTAAELAAEETRQQSEILQNDASAVEDAKQNVDGGVMAVYIKVPPAEAWNVMSIRVRPAT